MVRQEFKVDKYWEVIVYYDMDYNFFQVVNDELMEKGFDDNLGELWCNMITEKAKAVTCSNIKKHVSITIFNKHESYYEYINSLIHEAEHIKQAMLEAYQVEDKGEPPAYTIGYLVMRMWRGFRRVTAQQ